MCGRLNISDHPGVAWLMEVIGLPMFDFTPRYNVSPSSQIHTVFLDNDSLSEAPMTWGLLPHWAKPEMKPLINARAETIWEKPSFKHLIKKRRAIIPVTGFYEWKRTGKNKQAFYIAPKEPAMALGAIYGISKDGEMQCCIVTTEATDEDMLAIHHREPVMLDKANIKPWLENDDPGYLNELMDSRNRESDFVTITPVSDYVNNARNEGAKCIM